jgi:hypothetical protein
VMDETNREEAMEMLFKAKWNLPKAACYLGVSHLECKEIFNSYCLEHPPTYTGDDPQTV